MADVVELNLRQAVDVVNTSVIRPSVRERVERDGLDGPAIELVHFNVFIQCTRGQGSHMVDFVDYAMQPGTAVWIRPGQVQQWSDTDDDFDADVSVFDSSMIPDLPLFDRFIGTTSIADLGDDAKHLEQLTQWMATDLKKHDDYSTAAAVVGVMLRVFARHAPVDSDDAESPGRRLAALFLESVDSNITERSVSWHAQRIGASTRSVARATAESFDQRPKEVIDARVILEARRRLAWSQDDIAAIARGLRFSEASNFTKFFGARTGTSPSAFRDTVTSAGRQQDAN